jgi:N-acetyltransferase
VNQRVVGMVSVESITVAYPLLNGTPIGTTDQPSNTACARSLQPRKAVLGIHQLWVHTQHRQRGIASTLVDMARKHMCFGYTSIPIEQIAFSSPTESGLAFARQYNTRHQNQVVLVYDCS